MRPHLYKMPCLSVRPLVGPSVMLSSKSMKNGLLRVVNDLVLHVEKDGARRKERQGGRRDQEGGWTGRKDGRGGRTDGKEGGTRVIK